MADIFQQAQAYFDYSQALRRDLHRHPELGYHEVRTAGIVARELSQLGLEVATGIAETGVVALLEGGQPGPVVLLRFDMDALPIHEQTGQDYASETAGVMHACGHDGHVSIGLTSARILSNMREAIHGTVKFVFQPAEEGLGGAEKMLAEGVLEAPDVDYALALHLWNERPTGWVAVTSGALMAGADIFEVTIEGNGGHGALPQETTDPVVAMAQIISAAQSIVSRNISPLDAAVVSFCQVKAGDAFNVIPSSAKLGGTLRTFSPQVRQKVVDRFESLVHRTAEGLGCRANIDIQRLTPAVMNEPVVADRIRDAVAQLPGLNVEAGYHTMVSEDMAFMLERVPGCYMMVGSANAAKGLNFSHHHPRFDFDEAALTNATAVMVTAALELLK